MSLKKTDSKNPSDWMLFADADLKAVKLLVEKRICFTVVASKMAEVFEKTVKAALIQRGWPLVKTHDLQFLADALHEQKFEHMDMIQDLAESLSEYYVVGRYPGFDIEEPDWLEIDRQLNDLEQLADQIKSELEQKN